MNDLTVETPLELLEIVSKSVHNLKHDIHMFNTTRYTALRTMQQHYTHGKNHLSRVYNTMRMLTVPTYQQNPCTALTHNSEASHVFDTTSLTNGDVRNALQTIGHAAYTSTEQLYSFNTIITEIIQTLRDWTNVHQKQMRDKVYGTQSGYIRVPSSTYEQHLYTQFVQMMRTHARDTVTLITDSMHTALYAKHDAFRAPLQDIIIHTNNAHNNTNSGSRTVKTSHTVKTHDTIGMRDINTNRGAKRAETILMQNSTNNANQYTQDVTNALTNMNFTLIGTTLGTALGGPLGAAIGTTMGATVGTILTSYQTYKNSAEGKAHMRARTQKRQFSQQLAKKSLLHKDGTQYELALRKNPTPHGMPASLQSGYTVHGMYAPLQNQKNSSVSELNTHTIKAIRSHINTIISLAPQFPHEASAELRNIIPRIKALPDTYQQEIIGHKSILGMQDNKQGTTDYHMFIDNNSPLLFMKDMMHQEGITITDKQQYDVIRNNSSLDAQLVRMIDIIAQEKQKIQQHQYAQQQEQENRNNSDVIMMTTLENNTNALAFLTDTLQEFGIQVSKQGAR